MHVVLLIWESAMLFGVRWHSRLGCCQPSWSCKSASTHAISGFNRHSKRLCATKAHVIFSGIQPTGVPHLGNYLGALQQWARLQNEALPSTQLLYAIVDLHAITTNQDADQLRRWKRETLATLLAVGLDPERSTIFYQSAVWSLATTAVPVSIYVLRICRFRSTQSWCGYWAVQPLWDTSLAWHSGRFVMTGARSRKVFCSSWLIIYRASSPYQMKCRPWTLRVQKQDSNSDSFPILCCRPRISCSTGMASILDQTIIRSFFQCYSRSGRRGPSTAFGVCKTMRWSVQYCPWGNPCEATNRLMYVNPWSSLYRFLFF